MFATIENFPMPIQFGAWIACAAFALWFFLLVKKAIREFRGEEPHPPNSQLGQSVKEIRRRLETLERWREELIQKMEDDKMEILKAGEERGGKIHDRINAVLQAVSNLQGRIEQLNQGHRR